MRAGIELIKIDDLRPYLEGISAKSLIGSSHLTQYIPIIAAEEERIAKKAVKNQLVYAVLTQLLGWIMFWM